MTAMLASVNSLDEANLVQTVGVGIIDLKQPEQGALGALALHEVRQVVTALKPDALLSATIGDLPMQADLLLAASRAMAATGVDYVKIGFFPGGDWPACIQQLAGLAAEGVALIAVLFADSDPDFAVLEALAAAGFTGAMLDTMDKRCGSLTGIYSTAVLASFVTHCHQLNLLCGLAGSLTAADIQPLLALQPDYLGFRGALCQQHQRTAALDRAQIVRIRQLLNQG